MSSIQGIRQWLARHLVGEAPADIDACESCRVVECPPETMRRCEFRRFVAEVQRREQAQPADTSSDSPPGAEAGSPTSPEVPVESRQTVLQPNREETEGEAPESHIRVKSTDDPDGPVAVDVALRVS